MQMMLLSVCPKGEVINIWEQFIFCIQKNPERFKGPIFNGFPMILLSG